LKKDGLTKVLLRVTVILLIIIISLISFFGIYKRNLNSWENLLPKYNLSKELGESRTFSFVVDTSTKEADHSDDEEDTEDGEEHNHEQIPVNDPATLTKESYKKAKKIVEDRLKDFGIIDSTVSVNEETGAVAVTVPYTKMTDYTVSLGTNKGSLEIVDSETKEVLIPRNMVKSATAYYSNVSSSGTTQTYDLGVRLQFNSEGQKKLKEISKTYIETTDAEGNSTKKSITIRLNGADRYTTYFSPNEEYTYIAVPLYQSVSASEDDMETFNDAYNNCLIAKATINAEELPIVYTVSSGTYFKSNLGENYVRNIVIAIAAILIVVAIWMVIKFKGNGLMMAIIQAGYVAIILLFVRVASVDITLAGLIMILFMALANDVLLCKLDKNNKFNEFTRFLLNMIPFIITILVFNFAKEINIKSVGMTAIWGIFGFAYTFMTSLLLLKNKNIRKNGVEKNEK